MNTETINAIKEALLPVAEKIGQGAEYGWEIVLRQQFVEGVVLLILSTILFGVTLAGILLLWKLRKVIIEYTDGAGFLTPLILGVPAFAAIGNLLDGIKHLLNPAYYAIQFFMGLVGK